MGNTKVNPIQNNINNKWSNDDSMEQSILTKASTFFGATGNTFSLMAKAHFRGSSFYLGNVLIPILICSGVSAFMPAVNGFIWVLFLGMTFSGMATYGTVFFTIRKSTIIKNINMTANETGSLYFATFMLLGLSLFVTFNMILGWSMFLDVTGFSMYEMEIINGGNPEGIWFVDWGLVIHNGGTWYYWIEQIFLCFSISFFVEKSVSTQKNFFIFVLIYILAGIFFSGIFATTIYVDENGMIEVINDDTTMEELNGVAALTPYIWGHFSWTIGQFFPHFGANQMAQNIVQASSFHYAYDADIFNATGDVVWDVNNVIWNSWHEVDGLLSSTTSWQVRYYEIMPWVWVILFIFAAAMMERYKKK